MGSYNIAVVGVGAVGEEMLKVIDERHFPTNSVRVLARTARTITVHNKQYTVEATTPESFDNVDIALFAGTEGAVRFAEEAILRGAVVIDNGADFRMRTDVPLVVPEVNASALDSHRGLIANPNCSTAQLVVALKPLHDAARVKRVIISTYQAVSGAGSAAVTELADQNKSITIGNEVTTNIFPLQIAYNVIPQIGGFDSEGYTSEEMKLVFETRKILGDPDILVTPVVAARVPVNTGHSEAVYVELDRPVSVEEALSLWNDFPGVHKIQSGRIQLRWKRQAAMRLILAEYGKTCPIPTPSCSGLFRITSAKARQQMRCRSPRRSFRGTCCEGFN